MVCTNSQKGCSLVVILLLLFANAEPPEEIRIGLLSHEGLQNVEAAFDYAIKLINEDWTVLSRTNVVGFKLKMKSAEDSPSEVVRDILNLVSNKVSAIVGPFRSSHATIASYILTELRIPMITPTSTDPFLRNPLWSSYLLHMQPLDNYQSEALLDLVKYMDWNSVALISSMDSYGINGLTTFQKYSNERKIKIMANEMIPLTKNMSRLDVSQQVKNLKDSEARIFIMNVHSGYAKPVLDIAKQMGITGPDYAWVVTDATIKDADGLINKYNEFPEAIQGMVGYMSNVCCSKKKAEFMDKWRTESGGGTIGSRASLTYDSVWVIAQAINKLAYLDNIPLSPPNVDYWSSPVRYFNEGQTILDYISRVQLDGITGMIEFDATGGPVRKLYDLVNFRVNDVVKVGEWSPNIGLQMNATEQILWNGDSKLTPSSSVQSLDGRVLRLGITQEPPFISIDTNCTAEGRGNECYTGLCIELVQKLAKQLHFDFVFIESEDGKFGSPLANGKGWNGIIKMLLDGKLDIGTVNFAMNKKREAAIDFSMPFINTGLVMTTKIEEAKSDAFFWTKPFDVDLWYAILAFAVLMVLLIWLYDHMSPFGFYGRRMHAALRCGCEECQQFRSNKERKIDTTDHDECLFESRLGDPSENFEEVMSVGNSLWMIAACLFSIGPVEGVPRNMSGRVILAMWWFMILIVTAMYTANLAAFLTVTRMDSGINSISDLIGQSKVSWGTVAGTNAEILLKYANSAELEEVYKKQQPVKSVKEGFDRARNDDYIFFYGGAIVTFEANEQPCNLQIVGEQLFSFGYAFGFPPHSPYLETFNAALLTLSEQNELDSLWKKWSKGTCSSKKKSSSSSLNLANIYGLCYTFFVVIAVSGVILLGEIIYESTMDIKRFETSFLSALKYRLIYIWKRPNYQQCKYQDLAPDEGSQTNTIRTGDGKDLIQMVEYDGGKKPTDPYKIKDPDVKQMRQDMDLSYLTPDPDTIVLIGGNGYHNKMNGYELDQKPILDIDKGSLKSNQSARQWPNHYPPEYQPLHPARANTLPMDYSPASENEYNTKKRKNRENLRRNNIGHSTPPVSNGVAPNFEELFDKTLQRMTSHDQSRGKEYDKPRSGDQKSMASTHSTKMFSSPDISDTDDLRSESDMSLPT